MTSRFAKQSVQQATVLIAVCTVISQLLGMVREGIIANYFGTSAEYDILLLAMTIPGIVASILFLTIPSAAIPSLQASTLAAEKLGLGAVFRSSFFNTTNLLSLGIAAVLFVALPLVGKLLATGLTPGQADQVVWYGRIFCLLIPLKAYEAIFRSLLHIRHHFLLPTLAPLVYNSLFIMLLIALFPSMRSESYVIGMLVATVLQTLVVVVPFTFLKSMLHSQQTDAPHSDFDSGAYIKFLATVTIIETIGILADPFDRYIAGLYLDAGYVSATNYANITFFSPVRILIYSVSTAIFPLLAKYAATNEKTKLAESYHRSLAYVILFMIPATVFLYLFRHEIVHLLFERGRFDADSHTKTVQILEYYLLATPFFSMFLIQSRIFYALKAWLPFGVIRIVAIAAKAAVGFALIQTDWAMALGGGTVLLFLISAFAGEAYLWAAKELRLTKETAGIMAKALTVTVITSAVLWIVRYLLIEFIHLSDLITLLISLGVTAGLLLYLDGRFAITGISPTSLGRRP